MIFDYYLAYKIRVAIKQILTMTISFYKTKLTIIDKQNSLCRVHRR